jgi:hypothetical protein
MKTTTTIHLIFENKDPVETCGYMRDLKTLIHDKISEAFDSQDSDMFTYYVDMYDVVSKYAISVIEE